MESQVDPLTEAVAANALGYLGAMAGASLRPGSSAHEAGRFVEDLGLTLKLPTLDAWTGQAELLAGDPEAAERLWRRAYQALEGLGEKGNLSTIAAYLAEAVYVQGRDDEAAELTEISKSLTSSDDVTSYISWRSVRAKVAARRGRATTARLSPARRSPWQASRTGRTFAAARARHSPTCSRRLDGIKDAKKAAKQALALYDAKGSVAAADRLRARVDL